MDDYEVIAQELSELGAHCLLGLSIVEFAQADLCKVWQTLNALHLLAQALHVER